LEDGFEAALDSSKKNIGCQPARSMDTEIQIQSKAMELLQKTQELNNAYQELYSKVKDTPADK